MGEADIQRAVAAAGRAAKAAAASIARADGSAVTAALRGMADRLASEAPALLAANEADVEAALAGGMGRGAG